MQDYLNSCLDNQMLLENNEESKPQKTLMDWEKMISVLLFAMRKYGGGILYAALSLHMQRGCFQIRTHDQQVTKAQLYRCTKARPLIRPSNARIYMYGRL